MLQRIKPFQDEILRESEEQLELFAKLRSKNEPEQPEMGTEPVVSSHPDSLGSPAMSKVDALPLPLQPKMPTSPFLHDAASLELSGRDASLISLVGGDTDSAENDPGEVSSSSRIGRWERSRTSVELREEPTDGSVFTPFIVRCGPFNGKEVVLEVSGAMLGKGSSGDVLLGRLSVCDAPPDGSKAMPPTSPTALLSSAEVAVKVVRFGEQSAMSASIHSSLIRARSRLEHPNLALCYFVAVIPMCDPGQECRSDFSNVLSLTAYSALEYANAGSLMDDLRREERLPDSSIRTVLLDILPGLIYVHEDAKIVHNDIKPHNILAFLQKDPKSAMVRKVYKLADFGAMRTVASPEEVATRISRKKEVVIQESGKDDVYVGTATYMSPESCVGYDDLTSNDVWSLGITVFYLTTGHLPWRQMETSYPNIIIHGYRRKFALGGHYLSSRSPVTDVEKLDATSLHFIKFGPILDEIHSNAYSPEVRDFVLKCTLDDPFKRPSCRELMQHPLVRGEKLPVPASS